MKHCQSFAYLISHDFVNRSVNYESHILAKGKKSNCNYKYFSRFTQHKYKSMMPQKYLIIFALAISMVPLIFATDCSCVCRSARGPTRICESVEELWKSSITNTNKLMEWERYIPFVEHFSERWKKEISDIVDKKLNEYIAGGELHPKPESLIMRDGIQNDGDSVLISKPPEEDKDLVSNLLVKVEMVENRTTEVEEELKSERRVRRHLEQEVKETLNNFGDQLQNVKVPVDDMINEVQMVIYSSIEDMNKTIYEDHLKKLYYKVDGVVYKNETKELAERLEHVETEIHDSNNSGIVFKLAENLKSLEENLHLLNSSVGGTLATRIETLNSSIGGALIPRIETLEVETVRKDEARELEEKMSSLLNSTELFKTELADVWSDIQDIRNFETKFLNFSEEWSESLEVLQSQIEHLKNETLSNRPPDPQEDVDPSNEISQPKVKNDTSVIMPTALPDDDSNEVVEPNNHPENETEVGPVEPLDDVDVRNGTVISPGNETEAAQNDTGWVTPVVVNRSEIPEIVTTEFEEKVTSEPVVTPVVVDRTRIGRIPGEDSWACEKPVIDDPHLLADVVRDTFGSKKLKFGCHPIGLYAVSQLPVPPRCEKGSWKEPFPSCRKLSSMAEIETLSSELQKENPCASGSGEFPDPTNCSQFFKCSYGKLTVIPCPTGLNFNAMLKVCDYPRTTPCTVVEGNHDQELPSLIPPIHIEPNNLDKTSSHMGTGSAGQLVVHPRSSFTLHCVYPENIWGRPRWNVTYTHAGTNSRDLTSKEGKNRISLAITAAEEKDSGTYKCLTPFGKLHTIEVIVKAVVCPAFILEDDYEDVFYRPTPEGELRIMGTTAEFFCEDGQRIIAQCMADGSWSTGLPSREECSLKKRNSDNIWNCRPFDLSMQPDLILERNDAEKILTFKCAGRKRLIGNSFTRCRDDGVWSHVTLPRCKSLN